MAGSAIAEQTDVLGEHALEESSQSNAALVLAAFMLVVLLVVLGGGGAFFVWQRERTLRQMQAVQRELAMAERQARAVAEERLARTAHSSSSSPDQLADNAAETGTTESAIRAVLDAQQRAWNAGDIERFMEHYWKSDDLTFSSRGQVTRTWQGTMDGYRARYPSRREMGELSLRNLEIKPLANDAAFVLGEWQLTRESGNVGGNFTLVFRRLDKTWVIVHDHTSRAEQ
jgi:uncharacterized protein (TIGR02246 family)